MKRLRGSDAFAIYSETQTSPYVTLKAAIYQPVDPGDVPTFGEIKQFVQATVARQGARAALRIMRVPFDLHHPVWVVDPGFSVDNHIFATELPSPGSKEQFCDFLSDLMGKPMDPDRPLWEVWVVGGLEDGKVAMATRIHHALADGSAIAAMITDSHTKTTAGKAGLSGAVGETIPGKAKLIRDAMRDLLTSYTLDLPTYYRYLKEARERSRAFAVEQEDSPPPYPVPNTVLNNPGGSGRVYRYETVSLPAIKSLSKKFGCTVNAMVMGICSEALRRYLAEVDTVPETPLVSAMPVGALGEPDFQTLLNRDIHNNSLAVALVPLDLNIVDFGKRLQSIMAAAAAAIEGVRRSGGRRFDNYLDYLPGTVIRFIHASMYKRQHRTKRPHANVVISNVKGPTQPLYAVDGRLEMVELMSTGNLMDAGSLNITVWSYVNNLCLSCYSRRGALPEPERINRHIREVVEELEEKYLNGKNEGAND